MTESCATCRFFAAKDDPRFHRGHCRRYPPKVLAIVGDISNYTGTEWPEVMAGDWCGEYEATPGDVSESDNSPESILLDVLAVWPEDCEAISVSNLLDALRRHNSTRYGRVGSPMLPAVLRQFDISTTTRTWEGVSRRVVLRSDVVAAVNAAYPAEPSGEPQP